MVFVCGVVRRRGGPSIRIHRVVVGCGDMHVRAYEPDGALRWKFRYVNGIPGVSVLMAVNGDGVVEFLVSGVVMSIRAWCRVVIADGSLMQ